MNNDWQKTFMQGPLQGRLTFTIPPQNHRNSRKELGRYPPADQGGTSDVHRHPHHLRSIGPALSPSRPAAPTGSEPSLHAALHQPGPFNPGANLSTPVLNKILSLKFVEMAEISAEDPPNPTPGRPAPPKRPITDISQWLEKYSAMAAALTARFPEKAPEFFAYQAHIVRCERNYQRQQWVAYDRRYRRPSLVGRRTSRAAPTVWRRITPPPTAPATLTPLPHLSLG